MESDGFLSGACGTFVLRDFLNDGKGFNGNPEQSFLRISLGI
jgi:hypothetical protein